MPLLDNLRRLGFDRGVLGGSRPWLVVGGAAWGLRAIQRARRPEPETLLLEVLEPGETILVSHSGPPLTPRQRRKERRLQRRIAAREKASAPTPSRSTRRRRRRSDRT